jgi:hypothetical protein
MTSLIETKTGSADLNGRQVGKSVARWVFKYALNLEETRSLK